MEFNYEEFRFGFERWAEAADAARSGLYNRIGEDGEPGLFLGYFHGRAVVLAGQAPLTSIGGARVGKLRDVLAYNICWYPGSTFRLDPKGELTAISYQNSVRHNKAHYVINPRRLHGLPNHRANIWEHLTPHSPSLHGDCQKAAIDLLPMPSGGKWWEEDGRMWAEKIIKALVLKNGGVSLTEFYHHILMIEAAPKEWVKFAALMATCGMPDVEAVAHEIHAKKIKRAPNTEAQAPYGFIKQAINFMADPVLQDSLGPNPDFSLSVLAQNDSNADVSLIVPGDDLEIWAPMVRGAIGTIMLFRYRSPGARRLVLFIDEAAQLGNFESLRKAYQFGAAYFRCWTWWQDIGQISDLYGSSGLTAFFGSSQVRQFCGPPRDLETARMLEAMLGTQTLTYDDPILQGDARLMKRQLADAILFEDADPFQSAYEMAHHTARAKHRTKQASNLLDAAHALNLPNDRQILFISNIDCPALYAHKFPYYMRREMAGHYMANPYHPPLDRVRIKTRFGSKWAPIITEPVPKKYAHLPQYQDGSWSYVKGFRP